MSDELGFQEGLEFDYSEETLAEMVNNLKVSQDEWLTATALNTAKILRDRPVRFQSFGIYWWHVKRLLNERAPDPNEWWYSDNTDERMYSLTDRGSQALNIMQAVLHHRENWTLSPEQVTVVNGIAKAYVLFDEDFGVG